MATILRDSFDFYGAASQGVGNYWTSLFSTTFSSAVTRFGVGQCLQLPTSGLNGDPHATASFSASSSVVFLTMAFRKAAALGAAGGMTNFRFFDGASDQFTIRFTRDGNIEFRRGDASGTLLGTYSGAFAGGGAWDHFQIKITLGQSTAGSFEVRKNGSTTNDYTLSGINNCNTANTQVTGFEIEMGINNPAGVSLDDLWIYDDSTVSGDVSDWIGDVRAVQIMPSGDTSQRDFSRSTGSTNYTLVDEVVASGSDYVFSSTSGHVDEYSNSGFVATPTAILGLVVRGIGLKTDAGARSVGMRLNSNGTISDSAGDAMATGARSHIHNVNLNPDTGAVWTPAEVAAATFGPKVTA